MGSRRDCTWILGVPGFRVETLESADDTGTSRLRVHLERRGQRYPCSGCGRRTRRVRSMKERTWDDLPWAEQGVTLRYHVRRVRCRHCTERVGWESALWLLTATYNHSRRLDAGS